MRRALLLPLALLASCGPPVEEEDTGQGAKPVPVPETATGGAPVLVLRTTNGATVDSRIYADLNKLFNEQVDLTSLLMRGGLRTDDDGAPISPAAPDLAGTAVEQLAAFVATGRPEVGAADVCGNPMIASFVTPSMVAEAGGELGDLAPEACATGDCEMKHGTVEVVLSNVRFDGMLDVVVNVFADPIQGTPALWGPLVATFVGDRNPGFFQVPVMVSAQQFQLGLFGVLQRVKFYTHPGLGTREVIVLPHAPRTFTQRDLLVTWVPQSGEACSALWDADFGGNPPYGCREEQPVGIDRTSIDGFHVFQSATHDGTDASVLVTLQNALSWQLQTAAVCAPVGEKSVYLREGDVELFTCPESVGDLETCLAIQDMDEFACHPIEETEAVVVPDGASPVLMAEQREPYVLRYDPLAPYAGEVELQVAVDGDTVLYLPRDLDGVGGAERITTITGPGGVVQLPVPILDEHCGEEPAFRYEVGALWPAGTYTMTTTIGPTDPDLRIHVTSLETWKF